MSVRSSSGRFLVGAAEHRVELHLDGARLTGTVDGARVEAEVATDGPGVVVLHVGGRRVLAVVARTASGTLVSIGGRVVEVARADAHRAAHEAPVGGDPFAVSPMTGLVAKVHVKPGDAVAKGAPLFAVEAMKMEYVVRADRAVTVAEVRCAPGGRVKVGEVVVTFREDGA